MSELWLTTIKPSFQAEWLGLPPKESHQVLEKVGLLIRDPLPDGKVKKSLKSFGGKLHRIRCGDYRIFYTFESPYVSLLALRRRSENTYDEDLSIESLGGLAAEPVLNSGSSQPDWEKIFAPKAPARTHFPEPLSEDLLHRLRIPSELHPRLLRIGTREELYECPGIPDEHLLIIDDYLFERPLEQVMAQPDLIASDVSDLMKFKEGSLIGFLLKLSPEQKKYAHWALNSSGPTLVKGGPGTGKSTIALYRVRAFMEAMPQIKAPRILFTTYTNALVAFSQQLLRQLLGPQASSVEVRTADSLAYSIVCEKQGRYQLLHSDEEIAIMRAAVKAVSLVGSSLSQRVHRNFLESLGPQYLVEEIGGIIEGRSIASLEQYQKTPRMGRKIAFKPEQREIVWKVRDQFNGMLAREGVGTWSTLRRKAAEIVEQGGGPPAYDGVIVDEAQDLSPAVIKMLACICKAPNRLFLTADANQSIYRNGFRWTDIHDSLDFAGRTGVLRVNYRSTKEIGEASWSYLSKGQLEDDIDLDRLYANQGPLPAVRYVQGEEEETSTLCRFISGAAREFRLGIASCAVLVPTQGRGKSIAKAMSEKGLAVEFMTGSNLDLSKPVAKVLTMKSAKGLEFPIVALTGLEEYRFPRSGEEMSQEKLAEWYVRERRTLYVAMTRAMCALLLLLPAKKGSPLTEGLREDVWNIQGKQL